MHPEAMTDLETLGNGSNAVLISIGAVRFTLPGLIAANPDGGIDTGDAFYMVIDPQSCIDVGMEMDASTVMWWMQRDKAAQAQFKQAGKPIKDVLRSFTEWLTVNGTVEMDQGAAKHIRLWGNGAAFDNVLLANAYRKCGMIQPWKFWNDMCYRTVKNLSPVQMKKRSGVYHNALDDAISQTEHIIDIFKAQ